MMFSIDLKEVKQMVMWKAKKCPKCGGDMYIDVDEDVWFDHCLQCGYMRNLPDEVTAAYGGVKTVRAEGDKRSSGCEHCGNNAEMCRAAY
jgi:DNA-directed RNA polymerase subunit M/transcription elongation factor TFIIS